MDLINQLVPDLGVSEEQAKGGAGMLFKLAKDKLSGDEFGQIADKVSGLDDMVSAAPDAAGGGLMGAAAPLAQTGEDAGRRGGAIGKSMISRGARR